MLKVRLAALSLALCVVTTYSQDRPSEAANKENQHPSKPSNKTQKYKQGTPQNPLVVKRLDAEETPERRAQTSAERDEKTANERSLVIWTIALAVATIFLVLVAAVLFGLFVWQLKLIRRSLIDSKLAARAALRSAKVAERAYTNLERPYIYICGAYKLEFSVVQAVAFVEYSVANYGKTPAKIENAWAQMSTSEDGFPEIPLTCEGTHWLLRYPVLAPQERRDKIKQDAPSEVSG
jgi:hypothetical protein